MLLAASHRCIRAGLGPVVSTEALSKVIHRFSPLRRSGHCFSGKDSQLAVKDSWLFQRQGAADSKLYFSVLSMC